MRKDKCLFCGSRKCSYRIVTKDMSYDEVACYKHVGEMHQHSDKKIPGALRWFISSTGSLRRGEVFNPEV